MGFSLKKLVKQDLNPFDGPRPASTARAAAPQQFSQVAQQRIMARNPNQGAQQIARGPVYNNGPAQQVHQPSLVSQNVHALGLAGIRTGVGLGQGLSGLTDLATPGTGTSRVSKKLNTVAKDVDLKAQKYGVNAGYKTFQAPLNVATFLGPGLVTTASKIPELGAVANGAAHLSQLGAAGRIAGAGLRGTASGANVVNAATATGMQLGTMAGKGQKITPHTAVTTGLTNLALGGGLNATGQLGIEALHGAAKLPGVLAKGATKIPGATTKLAKNVVHIPESVAHEHLVATDPYYNTYHDQLTTQKQTFDRNAANGMAPGHPSQVQLQKSMNQLGAKTADMRKAVLTNTRDKLLMRGDPAVAQGGYVKNPLADNTPFKKETEIPQINRILKNKDTVGTGQKIGDYYKTAKGENWSVQHMSPDEYLNRAAKAMGQDPATWRDRPMGDVQKYAADMKKGDKFPMPWINEVAGSQEGRTRALAAKAAGHKTIPVAVAEKHVPAEPGAASTQQQIAQINRKLEAFQGERTPGYDSLVRQRDELVGKQPIQWKPTRAGNGILEDMKNPEQRAYLARKGQEGKVVEMSPDDYIKTVYDSMEPGSRPASLAEFTKTIGTRDLEKSMAGGEFEMPYVNKVTGGQDGLHRAMAAKQLGADKIPVLVVDKPKKSLFKPLGEGGHASGDSPLMPFNKPIANAAEKLQGKSLPKAPATATPVRESSVSSEGSIAPELQQSIKDAQDFLKNPRVRGGVRTRAEKDLAQLQAQARSATGTAPSTKPKPILPTAVVPTRKTLPKVSGEKPGGVSSGNDTPQLPKEPVVKNGNGPTRTDFPDEAKLNSGRLNLNKEQQNFLNDETTEVIGNLSNKEVEHIAKGAGMDTKTYSVEQTKKKIAEQLNVRKDAVRLMKEAEAARQAGDYERTAQLLKEGAEQGRVSRTQGSDLARQLQARKIVANELDTPQHRIFKLLDNAGVNPDVAADRFAKVDFTKPKEVIAAYRELVPASAAQWLDTLRYNSMLSSPLTQAVNIFGNAQNVALVAPVEKTLRGTIDAVGGLFGKERQYAAGEGAAYVGGSAKNIIKASNNFVDALRGTGKYANPDFEEYAIPLATKGVKGVAYKGLSVPMRVLDGMDKFFRTLAEGGEDAALNLREAKGIKIGGNRDALKEAEAAYRVFQTELGTPGQGMLANTADEFAKGIMKYRNSKNPLVALPVKFSIPFVKTINNISKQGVVDYSPLGFVNLKGNTDKVTGLTRAIMGTAIFGSSAALVAQGQMTWAEPRDPDERARFRSEGKQPYAIKFGNKWYNYSKLTPSVGFPMAMTAALHDAMESGKTDQSTADKILEAVSKYGNFLADQSYAKSIGDTLGAIGGDKEAIANAVSNNVQQVVPLRALTGWIARISDDTERKVDTSQGYIAQQVESLMQQYPGLRQKTNTRDYKGTPIAANNPILNGFSPVKVTNDRGVDPLDAEQDRLAKNKVDVGGLNKQQAAEFKRKVDPEIRKTQRELLTSADYQTADPDTRKKLMDKAKRDITAARKAEYMADKGIGEFAPDFTGERKSKLTAAQRRILGDTSTPKKTAKTKTKSGTKTKTTKTAKAKGTGTKKRSSGGSRARGTSNTAFAASLKAYNNAASQNQKALLNLVKGAKISSSRSKKLNVSKVALKKQNIKKEKAKVA